jgi:hypothetical protein
MRLAKNPDGGSDAPLSGNRKDFRMSRLMNVLEHNYLIKIRQMWDTGALPREAGYHQLTVSHDDWCGIFRGQRCHCEPDIQERLHDRL